MKKRIFSLILAVLLLMLPLLSLTACGEEKTTTVTGMADSNLRTSFRFHSKNPGIIAIPGLNTYIFHWDASFSM